MIEEDEVAHLVQADLEFISIFSLKVGIELKRPEEAQIS